MSATPFSIASSMRRNPLMVISCSAVFFTECGKMETPVGGVLNDRALVAMQAYLEKLGIDTARELRWIV